jgi:hypothetical protein
MKLDENINYIVSGLERSGTSMMMQILNAGELPMAFDSSRQPDENNPKGYYELEGGKIINKLMGGSFSFDKHKGEFVKITAYGLKYLPPGNYKIIYMERNIEEILDSMEKMAGIKDENRPETRKSFLKLNQMIKNFIANRDDVKVLYVNYNEMASSPEHSIRIIVSFLNLSDANLDKMVQSIDKKLYRQRRET